MDAASGRFVVEASVVTSQVEPSTGEFRDTFGGVPETNRNSTAPEVTAPRSPATPSTAKK